MLFMAEMTVNIPHSLDPQFVEQLKRDEKALSQKLQQEGKWRHLWRVAGKYANVSIFDVSDNDQLHTLLSSLPLFPYMEISVTPLAQHGSAVAPN
jgi:muconolactone D-isomerase